MTRFPPLEHLMPHRGCLLLLTGIVAHSPEETTCSVDIGVDSIVVTGDGTVPCWAAVEYMAQAIAVHAGLAAWQRGEPVPLGFLIGSRGVDFHAPIRADQSLLVTVQHRWGQRNLGLFDCTVRDGITGALVSEGQLSVALGDGDERIGRSAHA
jgi:predicted hotdog family 3-hydroxylacyl-ACP dehydratase